MLLPEEDVPVDATVIDAPNVTAPVYVCVPEVVMSLLSVMPVPVTANVLEIVPAKLTAPPLLMVKLFVPVLNVSVAVIVPLELRIVSGSVKV